MSPDEIFTVTPEQAASASLDGTALAAERERAVRDPDGFWRAVGERLDWIQPFSRVKDVLQDQGCVVPQG